MVNAHTPREAGSSSDRAMTASRPPTYNREPEDCNVPARSDRIGPGDQAEQPGCTGGGADEAQENPQRGGFACTVGAQKIVEFTAGDSRVRAARCTCPAEILDKAESFNDRLWWCSHEPSAPQVGPLMAR
ncbi:hypothetical protein NtRootA1_31230 [Arthrobacter sp. NtRootA1]|nr:hypothetical protein NtRootA1_31230 [Arthrobacter sp. NtRootA1]